MWNKLEKGCGRKRGELEIISARTTQSSPAFAHPYGKGKIKCNNSIAQMANNCLSITHTLVEDEEMKLKIFKNGVQIN